MKEALRSMTEDMMAMIRRKDFAPFNLALSGGETAKHMFSLWVDEYKDKIDWNNIRFFWVDERCVPPTDAQSNFGLADRLLFGKINLPASHYYRIVGEGAPSEEAILYSSLVKATVPTVDEVPIFDFVLLGVGEDGHTSSVFPDRKDLLTAVEPYAVSVNPYNKTVRICMTGKPMIEAKHTCFLVAGENKCSILKKILDKEQEDIYPASYIWHHARMPKLYASL